MGIRDYLYEPYSTIWDHMNQEQRDLYNDPNRSDQWLADYFVTDIQDRACDEGGDLLEALFKVDPKSALDIIL